MSAATVTDRRELLDLADAERAHRSAEHAWRSLRQREHELTTADARDADGRPLDDVGRTLERAEVADRKTEAASRLAVARDALRVARVDRANALLPEVLADHEQAAAAMLAARTAAEAAYAQLVNATWDLGEAFHAELMAARSVLAVASAAVDDEGRDNLKRDFGEELPAALDARGGLANVVERPTLALFGSGSATLDPSEGAFGVTLGEVVRLGRRRGLGVFGDTIRAAIEAADKTS